MLIYQEVVKLLIHRPITLKTYYQYLLNFITIDIDFNNRNVMLIVNIEIKI